MTVDQLKDALEYGFISRDEHVPDGYLKLRKIDDWNGQPALHIWMGNRDAIITENGEVVASGGSDFGWRVTKVW